MDQAESSSQTRRATRETSSRVKNGLDVASDLIAIVKDVSETLELVPVVGAIATVVGKIVDIGTVRCSFGQQGNVSTDIYLQEVIANQQLCSDLAKETLDWSRQIFKDLELVEKSKARQKPFELRNSLEKYQRLNINILLLRMHH
jgi:hypothetical protein